MKNTHKKAFIENLEVFIAKTHQSKTNVKDQFIGIANILDDYLKKRLTSVDETLYSNLTPVDETLYSNLTYSRLSDYFLYLSIVWNKRDVEDPDSQALANKYLKKAEVKLKNLIHTLKKRVPMVHLHQRVESFFKAFLDLEHTLQNYFSVYIFNLKRVELLQLGYSEEDYHGLIESLPEPLRDHLVYQDGYLPEMDSNYLGKLLIEKIACQNALCEHFTRITASDQPIISFTRSKTVEGKLSESYDYIFSVYDSRCDEVLKIKVGGVLSPRLKEFLKEFKYHLQGRCFQVNHFELPRLEKLPFTFDLD